MKSTVKADSHVAKKERGALLAELSIVLPFLTFLLLGVTDLGMFLQTYFKICHIAREGVRTAVAVPDLGSSTSYNAVYRVTTDSATTPVSVTPAGPIPASHRFIHDRLQLLLRADNGSTIAHSLQLTDNLVSVSTECIEDAVDPKKDKVEVIITGSYRPITPFNDMLTLFGYNPMTFNFTSRAEGPYLFERCAP